MASRRHRKAHRRTRRHRGGMAPVDYVNKQPMILNLAQGRDFARYHEGQHGGMAPYPGGVVSSMLPGDLTASARVSGTLAALNEASKFQDGGRKRRRSGSRKHRGGVLVPWGGSRKGRRASRKNRRNSSCRSRKSRRNSRKNRRNSRRNSRRNQYGGASYNLAVDAPMVVPESYKMLIPDSLRQQAGLHPEWADAANPSSMMPK